MTIHPWMLLMLVLAPSAAHADVYKSVDAQGHVTYSNMPSPGARRLDLGPVLHHRDAPTTITGPHMAATFPKVTPQEQHDRDQTRRQILSDELAREQQALDQSRQDLKTGAAVRLGSERNYQKYLDRIQGLKDAVTAHEKNVDAIRKALSDLH